MVVVVVVVFVKRFVAGNALRSEYEGVLPTGELRRIVPGRRSDSDAARRVRTYEHRPLSHPRLLRRLRGRRHHADGSEVLGTQTVPRACT